MKVLLEDKNRTVEIPDGLEPREIETELRKFYTPEELYGSTTFAEREGYRARKGRAGVDDGKLWFSAMMGELPRDVAKQQSIEINAEFTQENDEKYQAYNWPERFAGATTELAPYMLDSAIEGGKYGEILGAGFAATAFIAGQAGPQAFIPEEIITVPGAYLGGRAVGQAWGTWMNAAKVEGGQLFKSMVEDGVDPKIARNFAGPAGYVIGAIELLQIEKLIPTFGKEGITSFLKSAAKKGASKAGAVLGRTAARLAKNLAGTTAIETTEELSQEIIGIVAEAGASIYEDMATEQGYSGPDTEEIKERLKETIIQSLFGFPLLGLPRAIHSTVALHGREKFIERLQTKRAEEALTTELSDQIEEAAKMGQFEEFHESLGEEFDDKEAQKYGFDNRQLFEEAVWNISRDAVSEDRLAKEITEDTEKEENLPPIASAMIEITQKINELRAAGKTVPESLIKRQQVMQETLESLKPEDTGITALGLKKIIREKTGQIEEAPKRITEMRALKEALRAEARGALRAERVTKKELKSLKRGLVETIKTLVPAEGQKEFLSIIAGAETGKDLFKAMGKLEQVAEETEKRQMLRAIKMQMKRIEASKSISIDYIKRIQDFLSQYDLKARTGEAMKSLQATKEFIAGEQAAGRKVEMPEYVLESLDILSRKSLKELKAIDLQDVLARIKSFANLGKTKLRSRRAAEKFMKAKDLADLAKDSKKIESKKLKEGDAIRGKLSLFDKFLNDVKRALNTAQEKDIVITPMDAVMDRLDGAKNYEGANYRIFKRRIDLAYSLFLDEKDTILARADKKADGLELNEDSMERIGLHAAREQKGGLEKLLSFFTQIQIESVILTENEMKFYNFLRKALDDLRPKIEKIMRETYNEPLGEVENYFPYMTDFEAMSDSEVRDRFGDKVITYSQTLKKNVEMGFTKERKGGKYRIKLNAAEIFSRHIDNALYLIHVGKHTKYLGELAASEEYRESAGDAGQEIVREWLDLIARKGRAQNERLALLDWARNYTGVVALGFKLSSALVQITSLMDGAALIGPRVFDGFRKIITSSDYRNFVLANIPEVRDRIADDPAFEGFKQKNWSGLTKLAYLPLKTLDKFAASGVALGAYFKYLEDNDLSFDMNNPDMDGIEYAQKMMRRTQSSSQFKDLPLAVSKGKLTGNISLDKIILQFQSFMLNRWSLIRHDLWRAGIRTGNQKQAISIALWLIAANFAELGIRRWTKEMIAWLSGEELPEDDEDKEFYKNLGQILQNIPFIGSAYYAALYGDLPVPSISMAYKIAGRFSSAIKATGKAIEEEEDIPGKKWLKFFLSLVPGGRDIEQFVKEE